MDINFDEIIEDLVIADDIQSDSIGSEEMMIVAGIKDVKVNGESVVKANVANIQVPTKVSELENDSEFVDKTVNNLVHYYLKTETFSKAEINNIIGSINSFSVLIVDTLPTDNISTKTIYLIAKSDSDNSDYYDEYMYINNAWERIGSTMIDLSNYVDLSSKQRLSNKEFDSIGVVGEGIEPVYEDREVPAEYEYNVENISTTYGFELNDNGYYESNNQKKSSSYALCKISFNMWESGDLVFEVINSGETNFDFGIFSKLDQTLSSSSSEDTSETLVYKSYKGLSSTTPDTLTYTAVPAGEHFITIKFKKDGSGDSGNDSLQFKVLSPVGESETATVTKPVVVGYADYTGILDIDNDKDLTYSGVKVVTDQRFKPVEEELLNKINSSDIKTLTVWTVSPDNYIVNSNTMEWKGTITDGSKLYNPVGQSDVSVGGNSHASSLIPRSVFDKLVGIHNNLVAEINKIYNQGYLKIVPSATKEKMGGVRIWTENDTLYISTSYYDNNVQDNLLSIAGAYEVEQSLKTIKFY